MALKNPPRKVKIIGLIAIILIVVVYFAFIKEGGRADALYFTAEVEATETEVSSKIPGRIEWLCCRSGEQVKAGSVAARIENVELRSRVDEAKAALVSAEKLAEEARIGVENATLQKRSAEYEAGALKSEVVRAEAVYKDARTNRRRAAELFKKGYMSGKDYDAVKTQYDVANANRRGALSRTKSVEMAAKNADVNIAGARARIESANARVALAEAQLKVVQTSADEAELSFPTDGIISYRSFETGENVVPGASIYTVHDMSNLRVRFDVEESVVYKIKLNDSVKVELPSDAGQSFDAKIIEIAEVAGFATQRDVTRGRSDIKTFRIKAALQNPGGVLKPGMTVKATVVFNDAASLAAPGPVKKKGAKVGPADKTEKPAQESDKAIPAAQPPPRPLKPAARPQRAENIKNP